MVCFNPLKSKRDRLSEREREKGKGVQWKALVTP